MTALTLKKRLGLKPSLGLGKDQGGGVPAGFSPTTSNGVAVTYYGKPVFDNGRDFYVRAA